MTADGLAALRADPASAVVALDYDGTIATNDVMDPSVRAAIGEARDAGIAV